MMRSKAIHDQEKFLINEIKRLDVMIKKEERDQINLKKALKLDEIMEEPFKITNKEGHDKNKSLKKQQRVYSRQQYLSKKLELPGKIAERLT